MDEVTRVAESDETPAQGSPDGEEQVRDIVLFSRIALARVLDGATRFTWETERVRPDGSATSFAITARPLVVEGKVAGIIEDFRDNGEGRLARDVAQHLATHDSLTGLPNRLLFADRLDVAIAQAERAHLTPAVLFCDIDSFKAVNDTWGHPVGDEVLRFAAATFGSAVRKADTVARFGGDEIVVLLPDVHSVEHAEMVARKMLDGVRVRRRYCDATFAITMSIGIALLRPGDDADALIRRADDAMYQAKQFGGDGHRIAVG